MRTNNRVNKTLFSNDVLVVYALQDTNHENKQFIFAKEIKEYVRLMDLQISAAVAFLSWTLINSRTL